MGRMEGKVALITGAARGQGRSHALRLAEEGADIIAFDICADLPAASRHYPGATEADLETTAELARGLGRRVVTGRVDVRDRDALRDQTDAAVQTLGGLDVVVANAGILSMGLAHEMSPADWAQTLDTNLTGAWNTTSVTTPHLIRRGGGSIIITSSTAGINGTANLAAYTASKHGVVGLMRCLCLELGQHSIRVNTVHPCAVATDMILNEDMYRLFAPHVQSPVLDDARAAYQSLNVLPVPWIEPADVSNAVLFLASDEGRYVTGCQLSVDAGATTK